MKYIDANVFIYPAIYDEDEVKEAKHAKNVLLKIAKGDMKACSASLTWDEIVWVVRKISDSICAKEEGEKFLTFPNLKIVNVDRKVVGRAQELVEQYDLKPRDAIHVACAIENGIREIVSTDNDFDRVKEIRRIKPDEIKGVV